nr:hypothetical protein Iba_chr11aCG14950 [Ipomoea batatas]
MPDQLLGVGCDIFNEEAEVTCRLESELAGTTVVRGNPEGTEAVASGTTTFFPPKAIFGQAIRGELNTLSKPIYVKLSRKDSHGVVLRNLEDMVVVELLRNGLGVGS